MQGQVCINRIECSYDARLVSGITGRAFIISTRAQVSRSAFTKSRKIHVMSNIEQSRPADGSDGDSECILI